MENQSLIFLKSAKKYLSFGWSLLPMQFVKDGDGRDVKKPMVKWKDYQTKQPTLEEVTYWLEQGWFLGVITGKTSGIVIVDDDRIKHGLKPTILKSTVVSQTKSGGKHFYFKYDRLITNHANSEIFVDIRGEGGYCVLPPFNGYQWVNEPTLDNLSSLEPLNELIEKQIVGEKKQGERVELSDFEKIPSGSRNDTIHRLACSIWNNTKLGEQDKILQIQWINDTRCQPPLSSQELQVIINQAKNFVLNNPSVPQTGKKEITNLSTAIERRMEEKELEKDCPSTGLGTLDSMVHGFIPKHTYVLTGDTNVGKTSLACYFACAVASQNKKVLYVALEPDTSVVDYIASVYHNKSFTDLTKEDYNFQDLPIDLYLKTQIKSIDELMLALKTAGRYDLVIIDHVGYFVTNPQNTNQEQSNVMKKLAQIATENLCSVVAIAHMRKPETRSKKKIPTINDISGSAAFKQDATDVWIVHRNLDPDDETNSRYTNTGMLIVGKSKSGMTGPIPICFGFKKAGIYEAVSLSKSIDDNFT